MEEPREYAHRVVRSVAGRDKGSLFLVLRENEDGTLLVADGRKRRLERPKKKNRKHLRLISSLPALQTAPTGNRCLRELLRKAQNGMTGDESNALEIRMEEGSFCRRTM